jgi:hypothetical protein
MTIVRLILSLLVIGTVAGGASAATLGVELGWGGSYRNMRWSPVFVTAADSKPRNVIIELYVPHDSLQSMTIRQMLTIGPMPSTVALYAPLSGRVDEISVKLLDAKTGRRLEHWVNDPMYDPGQVAISEPVGQLIGISGRGGAKRLIEAHFDKQIVTARSVEMLRLPAVARGYESFDALMLDQPDLTRMSLEQQEALIDWVRTGGHLVCWLGEDQLPAASPILQALPAVVGENTTVSVSAAALDAAGLPPRFGAMKGRLLSPTADASLVQILGGEVQALKRQLGLGSIVVVPFDCSTLLISDQNKARAFWKPLLDGAVDLNKKEDTNSTAYYYGYNDPSQLRRSQAARSLMDFIGNVPGAGRFGFSWVAMVMIGLMIVVGPVDWIVLKRLGRQPWTWVTTSGWIVLVTLAALYLGYSLRSGELHYRTMRLIDQAGGATVAAIDTVAIYSPRTAEYEVKAEPDGWWEPLTADQYYYRSGMKTDIDFHQDYRGNTPEKMRINVWNLRFLTSDSTTSGPPMLEASLRIESRGSNEKHVVGTIRNLTAGTLKDLSVRTPEGYAILDRTVIAAGTAAEIDRPLHKPPAPTTQYGPYGAYADTQAVGGEHLFRLSMERSSRIDRLLQARRDVAVVYADCGEVPVVAPLAPTPSQQWHRQMVRALVPLTKGIP